jgi:uncharacterized protein (DUF58 family)
VPVASAALVLAGWGVVAHNSGAGWVQALGDVVAGTLVLGLAGPALVLLRARLAVVSAPTDGTAGLPVEVRVVSSSRVRVTPVDPPGPASFAGPQGSPSPPGGDPVDLVPGRRGVFSSVRFDVASAAPFGLLWWTRRVQLRLPAELHIGPRLGSPVDVPRRQDDRAGDSTHRSPKDIGEPRGVRPYRPGDGRRWVHWPATAHSGELMVREMEGPTADPVVVVVTLPADEGAAEQVAQRALGTLVTLFERGTTVVLTTVEATGPRTGAVTDRRSAGRRLARAVWSGHRATGGDTGVGTTAPRPAGGRPVATGAPGVVVTVADADGGAPR